MWPQSARPPAAYLRRKAREISLLSEFTGNPREDWVPESFDDLIATKLGVAKAMRLESLRRLESTLLESNLKNSRKSQKVFGFSCRYEYQRLSVQLETRDCLRLIYKGLAAPSGSRSRGVFTQGCQGAISTLLEALRLLHPDLSIEPATELYWETADFLRTYGFRVGPGRAGRGARVIYYDSSSNERLTPEELELALDSAALLIVDTTCFPLASPRLAALLKSAARRGVPAALLRSHLKLDCLATEYGRLGSLVLVAGARPSARSRAFLDALWAKFTHISRFHGLFAGPAGFYPFYNSRAFHALNDERIAVLRRNNRAVVERLTAAGAADARGPVEIRAFPHDLFFWVVLKRGVRAASAYRLCGELGPLLDFQGVPFRFAPSYPWDFLSVTAFAHDSRLSARAGERTVFRVSVADFDEPLAGRCADGLLAWLQRPALRRL